MRALGTTSALAALLLCLPAAPAAAESVTVRDARDPGTAGLDLVRAHFTNTGPDVGGTLTFHQLAARGTVRITIRTWGHAVAELRAVRTADGTLRTRMAYVDDTGRHRVRCPIGHTWAPDYGLVRLGVSVHCLRGDAWGSRINLRHTRFAASTSTGVEQDRTRMVRVRRTAS